MKRWLVPLLVGMGVSSAVLAEEAPNDATHLNLRAFVYTAFSAVKKTDQMPQYPMGRALTKADLYSGVAAAIRVRGKACANVIGARAMDPMGEKIDVRCSDGGHYHLLPASGEVQGV